MANDNGRQKQSGKGTPWHLAGLGDWFQQPPAPAFLPPAPAVDQRAWTESLNAYHPASGNETVAQIGGIINAETQGMKDRKGENEPLLAAREKIAHVRINGIRQYGPKVQTLAWMSHPKLNGPDYRASVDAARLAAIDDVLGIDATPGGNLIAIYSADRRNGWLLIAYPVGHGRLEPIQNAYRLRKLAHDWQADEGNGGQATYAAMSRFAAWLVQHRRLYRVRLTPHPEYCSEPMQ